MKVEIWSDVVCPWCAIGKRRFEQALRQFAHRDEVQVHWRSFELDPDAPRERDGDLADHLASKYGISMAKADAFQHQMTDAAAAEGWEFHLDRARNGNSFDAHRLIHLGAERGIQDAVKERLLAAYLSDGERIGDAQTLIRLGTQAGLEEAEARAALTDDRYAEQVRADERQAAAFGISAVPFFVIDRAYGIPGAQPSDVLLAALETAWSASHPLTAVAAPAGDSGTCADGSCPA